MAFFIHRDVPSSAALPVIRPALLKQSSMSDRAKVAMQEYLNHFLGNMDIVNSREVCILKHGYILMHLWQSFVVHLHLSS